MGNITKIFPINILVQPEIVKIFQLEAYFPRHEINIFSPPFRRFSHQFIIVFPLLQWGIHPVPHNPPSPRGMGA